MFRHVVMFSWNDTVDAAHVAAVAAQLDGLVAVIPEIKAYLHGPDAGLNPGNFDYVPALPFRALLRGRARCTRPPPSPG